MFGQKQKTIWFTLAFILLTLPLVVLAQENAKSGAEVLTNDKVVTMTRAGLPTTIIVNKIRASKTNFNTSTEELIRLQQTRVPADIINAMVEASSSASTVTPRTGAGDVSKTDPHDPVSAHEAGIYLWESREGKQTMTQLNPRFRANRNQAAFLRAQ